MVKTVGVLGLGVSGSTIAKELGEQHYDVIAVDKDPLTSTVLKNTLFRLSRETLLISNC
ncbi:MAG: hypothetical protein U5K84_12140 [Alkalibacterium sp.]|nr:hypothetical protein [Alkalibacterium sp.]